MRTITSLRCYSLLVGSHLDVHQVSLVIFSFVSKIVALFSLYDCYWDCYCVAFEIHLELKEFLKIWL